jgi:hypothetical protein
LVALSIQPVLMWFFMGSSIFYSVTWVSLLCSVR